MLRAVAVSAFVAGALVLSGCSSDSPDPTVPAPTPSAAPTEPEQRLPQGKPFRITPTGLGIHSFQGNPATFSGNFRMVCYPLWKDVETAQGKYNWKVFDAAIEQQQGWGAKALLYAFCGTPEWAGGKVTDPSAEVYGPGTTAAPKDMNDFKDYVQAVVKRYKGTIGAYEVWNEASSPQFWQGTPAQMRQMTQIVHKVVKRVDPKAKTTMASMQTHSPEYYSNFVEPYLDQLKKTKWPFDVYNGHFYPADDGGPAARRQQIAMFRKSLADRNAPPKPLWDTEVNYSVSLPGGEPDGRIVGEQAAAWATRTFLDSWRLDLPLTYWYFATLEYNAFPGIQTRPGDPATSALAKFNLWTVNNRFMGCEEVGDLVSCSFVKDGQQRYIAWAETAGGQGDKSTEVRASFPLSGPAEACKLTEDSCTTTSALTVDQVPTLITPQA